MFGVSNLDGCGCLEFWKMGLFGPGCVITPDLELSLPEYGSDLGSISGVLHGCSVYPCVCALAFCFLLLILF